ncbi:MAG TPA: hypothetical protein VGE74_14320 [Gemmata sp.]
MPVLSHPAFGPKVAIGYVTGGSLLCVWTLVWYFTREAELSRSQWFWIAGLFLSGITFIFLGLVLGPLGRVARQAEMPPPSALQAEAVIQQTAAAHQPVVAPVAAAPAPVAQPQGAAPAAVPASPAPVAPVG